MGILSSALCGRLQAAPGMLLAAQHYATATVLLRCAPGDLPFAPSLSPQGGTNPTFQDETLCVFTFICIHCFHVHCVG